MSATDELREFIDGADGYELWCPHHKRELEAIADHIDLENAKLRELVRHLRECVKHMTCALCPYAGGVCDFDYDMRKLGIEVDE